MLVSHSGQVLWYGDVSTNGWPSTAELVQPHPRRYDPGAGGGQPAAVEAMLAGSPRHWRRCTGRPASCWAARVCLRLGFGP